MMFIGFDISTVKTEADMIVHIDALEDEILMVSEARKRRVKKVRKVEAITRILLKKCALKGWKDQLVALTKMLQVVEDIKADVGDVVNGYDW